MHIEKQQQKQMRSKFIWDPNKDVRYLQPPTPIQFGLLIAQ